MCSLGLSEMANDTAILIHQGKEMEVWMKSVEVWFILVIPKRIKIGRTAEYWQWVWDMMPDWPTFLNFHTNQILPPSELVTLSSSFSYPPNNDSALNNIFLLHIVDQKYAVAGTQCHWLQELEMEDVKLWMDRLIFNGIALPILITTVPCYPLGFCSGTSID